MGFPAMGAILYHVSCGKEASKPHFMRFFHTKGAGKPEKSLVLPFLVPKRRSGAAGGRAKRLQQPSWYGKAFGF